jgi:mono/diheme cytochrome c family protein
MHLNARRSITVPWISKIALITLLPVFGVVRADEKPIIKHVPVVATNAGSGQEMFRAYCAACHGAAAKGDGPAAPALKRPPADLTQLTKNAGGKFPVFRVYDVIRGDTAISGHGSNDMPVWGRVFRSMTGSDSLTHHRIGILTGYIESLQR